MRIRDIKLGDSQSIARIYNHYILNTAVTFEEKEVSAGDITHRIKNLQQNNMPWHVAVDEKDDVIGYAYASKWKGRSAYRFSVEVTVYLAPDVVGNGLGSLLYKSLFACLKERGYHSVIGGITLPNDASIKLHEKFGMVHIGTFSEVGFKFNKWIDVGYWQGKL